LVEVLVAIAIIALLAAISAPFYRSVSLNLNLNAAGRDLASDLRYAQQLAVTTQINHQVVLNLAGNSYVVRNASTGAIIKSRIIDSSIVIGLITDLPGNTVTFNPTGAVADAGSIILSNSGNREFTINIKPSGYVKTQ